MENKNFEQILEIVKALDDEFKPVVVEISKLKSEIEKIREWEGKEVLINLITRITKTARRHDIETKIISNNKTYTIGTNHNGLGYVGSWGSQLTDFTSGYYGNNNYSRERKIRDILFNSDAVIELTANIKKSNQKTFMRVIKILQKHNLKIPFKEFQEDEIDNINVDIDGTAYKINIKIDGYDYIDFSIILNDEKISGIKFYNDIPFDITNEKVGILQNISKKNIRNCSIEEVKASMFLVEHKESMIKEIKATRERLKAITSDYKNEHKELNELLEPFLALEKL